MHDRDPLGLAHNTKTGGYVSISKQAELMLFDKNGELEEVRPLRDVLPDLYSTYDQPGGRLENSSVSVGNNVVAIVNVRDASVTHIWTYELDSRKAQLTYKRIE